MATRSQVAQPREIRSNESVVSPRSSRPAFPDPWEYTFPFNHYSLPRPTVAPKPVQPLEYNLVSNNFSEFQKCHGRGTRAIVRLVLRLSAVVSIHPIMPAN